MTCAENSKAVVAFTTRPVSSRHAEERPRRSWFARLLDAMAASREQAAKREIKRYAHLMPSQDEPLDPSNYS